MKKLFWCAEGEAQRREQPGGRQTTQLTDGRGAHHRRSVKRLKRCYCCVRTDATKSRKPRGGKKEGCKWRGCNQAVTIWHEKTGWRWRGQPTVERDGRGGTLNAGNLASYRRRCGISLGGPAASQSGRFSTTPMSAGMYRGAELDDDAMTGTTTTRGLLEGAGGKGGGLEKGRAGGEREKEEGSGGA